ncbi:hypothetical protein T492DRAFT_250006 [Pavlovales sp. CCMP2436]|nr:hypothetical protein T492DRAFT_250006 [Pavlovales sp. CCMP2436]
MTVRALWHELDRAFFPPADEQTLDGLLATAVHPISLLALLADVPFLAAVAATESAASVAEERSMSSLRDLRELPPLVGEVYLHASTAAMLLAEKLPLPLSAAPVSATRGCGQGADLKSELHLRLHCDVGLGGGLGKSGLGGGLARSSVEADGGEGFVTERVQEDSQRILQINEGSCDVQFGSIGGSRRGRPVRVRFTGETLVSQPSARGGRGTGGSPPSGRGGRGGASPSLTGTGKPAARGSPLARQNGSPQSGGRGGGKGAAGSRGGNEKRSSSSSSSGCGNNNSSSGAAGRTRSDSGSGSGGFAAARVGCTDPPAARRRLPAPMQIQILKKLQNTRSSPRACARRRAVPTACCRRGMVATGVVRGPRRGVDVGCGLAHPRRRNWTVAGLIGRAVCLQPQHCALPALLPRARAQRLPRRARRRVRRGGSELRRSRVAKFQGALLARKKQRKGEEGGGGQ